MHQIVDLREAIAASLFEARAEVSYALGKPIARYQIPEEIRYRLLDLTLELERLEKELERNV